MEWNKKAPETPGLYLNYGEGDYLKVIDVVKKGDGRLWAIDSSGGTSLADEQPTEWWFGPIPWDFSEEMSVPGKPNSK